MSLTWFAVITIVSFLVFLCIGQVVDLPVIAWHVGAILFIACTAVIILWAAYLDYKDKDIGGKVAFILFGLLMAAILTIAHYHPNLAQQLFY